MKGTHEPTSVSKLLIIIRASRFIPAALMLATLLASCQASSLLTGIKQSVDEAKAAASGQTTATPTFSPSAGTYSSNTTVTLSDTTAGAVIYYTITAGTVGVTPSSSSTSYSNSSPILISGDGTVETIEAIAVANGYSDSAISTATFVINYSQASTPQFSPTGGRYTSAPQTVVISSSTSNASIYYTTDGSAPDKTSGTLYSGPVGVAQSETLKAIAYGANLAASTVAEANFTMPDASPSCSPAAGTYATPQHNVILSSGMPGATIRYTTDSSTPTEAVGSIYSGAIDVSTSQTIKAIAYKTGWADSLVSVSTFTITGTIATPSFSLPQGTYGLIPQTISITTTPSDAFIYYTTNGSEPTQSSTLYSAPINLYALATAQTIKAKAFKTGWTDSATATAAYTIPIPGSIWTNRVAPTAANALAYGNGQFVAIKASSSGVYTSADGISWSSSGNLPNQVWGSVIYGKDRFIAISTYNESPYYSTDGLSWTSMSGASGTGYYACAYGNNRWIATAGGSWGITSTNGTSWASNSNSPGGAALAYGGTSNYFVSIGSAIGASKNTSFEYSSDGVAWTTKTTLPSQVWTALAFGNSTFVAVSGNSLYPSTVAAHSADGVTWTSSSLPGAAAWSSIAYGNGMFVAVAAGSNQVAVSPDGVTWTAYTIPDYTGASGSGASSWKSIAYGNGIFVVAGSGYFATSP